MNLFLTDDSLHNHIIMDDIYKVFIVENVTNYSLVNFNTHEINTNAIQFINPSYYFVIDLLYNEAFGHWVYESAIYLPIFKKMKDLYPTIKLLLKTKKTYKQLFLDFFDISNTDVVYDNDMNNENVCFFPSPISSLNETLITENYKKYLEDFVRIFSDFQTTNNEQLDYVIMPRQTKENCIGNDRSYNIDFIYNILICNFKKYSVLETDNITNITEQITNIRSSHNVILTDGSPFLVNIMFCKNQKIYVIDQITNIQSQYYVKIKYIIDMICRVNSIHFKHIDIQSNTKLYTIYNFDDL